MYESKWSNPSECDRWDILVEKNKSIFKSERYIAYADGYREGKHHAYIGGPWDGRQFYGSTPAEAEEKIRKHICGQIAAYDRYCDHIKKNTKTFSSEDICPNQ